MNVTSIHIGKLGQLIKYYEARGMTGTVDFLKSDMEKLIRKASLTRAEMKWLNERWQEYQAYLKTVRNLNPDKA